MKIRNDGGLDVVPPGSTEARAVRLPRVQLEAVISTHGANGDIFAGTHEESGARVAVKVWYPKRSGDSRDKLDQGVSEMIRTSRYPAAVAILDGGVVEGLAFCVMDLVEGMTLREWIQHPDTTLAAKCYMAWQVLRIDAVARSKGQYHGDLHTGNILAIKSDAQHEHERFLATLRNPNNVPRVFLPAPRIIDVGTSRFTTRRNHRIRHWNTLIETINRLVAPIRVDLLMADSLPDGVKMSNGRFKVVPADESRLEAWLVSALQEFPLFLAVGLGFYAPAPIYQMAGDLEKTYPQGSSKRFEADRLRDLGHELTEASVGGMDEWETYPNQMWKAE